MNKITSSILTLTFSLTVFIQFVSFAQFGMNEELLTIEAYQSFDKVFPGSEFKVALEIDVSEGWHINSHTPYEDYLIPTELTVLENPNFKLESVAYPEPHDYKLAFSETPLSVWEGKIFIGGLVKADKVVSPGKYSIVVELFYQACNDMSCIAPTVVSDTLEIIVADKKETVNKIMELNGIAIITADHGNLEEMDDQHKTAHSLNPIMCAIVDSNYGGEYEINKSITQPGLGNVAATILNLMGYEKPHTFMDSLIKFIY